MTLIKAVEFRFSNSEVQPGVEKFQCEINTPPFIKPDWNNPRLPLLPLIISEFAL